MGWTAGALFILCFQLVALMTPPATPGRQTTLLIGPAAVVLSALAASPLILWLLIRLGGKFNRVGGTVGVAATGFLGSFLTIFAMTIAVNLFIANIARVSN